MGTLRDEAYENLDYLSQLTEVVIGPQNLVLGRAPDRWDLTIEDIIKFRGTGWGRETLEIDVYRLLVNILPKEDWNDASDIKQYFKFEISNDFELDLANKKMTGTIALVKIVQQLEEKKLLEIAIEKSIRVLSHHKWPTKRLREKVETVLNMFEPGHGSEWAKKLNGQVSWSAHSELKNTISSVILENKWRIRDTTVIIKIGEWVNSYLEDKTDTSTGLVNLLKLKIMLDKDLPVYSVDEVKNAITT
jgi:hypothetical protein